MQGARIGSTAVVGLVPRQHTVPKCIGATATAIEWTVVAAYRAVVKRAQIGTTTIAVKTPVVHDKTIGKHATVGAAGSWRLITDHT